MMRTYRVTQCLAKERVIEVDASSPAEAAEFAQFGFGEVVSGKHTRLRLLCNMKIERVDEDFHTQQEGQHART